jgi:hypothetical protein
MRFFYCCLFLCLSVRPGFSQEHQPTPIRPVPAMGIELDAADEKELKAGLQDFSKVIDQLKVSRNDFTKELIPDVLIYYKAVDYALRYHEFYSPKDVSDAKELLKTGQQRAADLLQGKSPWTKAKGEVMRGYLSKIDNSVQPYGLSIPEDYDFNGSGVNLSVWFHGRGEKLTEVNFIANGKGFLPKMPEMKNTIMLYPYGRYCNGFKFAGEVDVQEALANARKQYKIKKDGVSIRGFSMGGAAVWHLAVHYPDVWLSANPGAGFAETTDFLRLDNETLHPSWYEKDLLHLYDCTDYASNLSNLPIVAYNGDKDLQKQAADVMEKAMNKEGLSLTRIVGPNTAHAYHPVAAKTVDSLLHIIDLQGKRKMPKDIHFNLYTLKYNKMYWLTVNALKEHWKKARVDGDISNQTIILNTLNVSELTLDIKSLSSLIDLKRPVAVSIDGVIIPVKTNVSALVFNLHLENKQWVSGAAKHGLVKKHNLQGPIDDAFMSAFIVVKPTGNSKNEMFDRWSKSEMERFITQWRSQFRGDAVVKNDNEITSADLSSNLIVFGDQESNSVIAKLKDRLPIKWNSKQIQVGRTAYPSGDHALIIIYPNPLNAQKYIVLNSGFTFREESFLNNAKQVAMLPDWAIIDLNTPPGPANPGKVIQAGFFDENWKLLNNGNRKTDAR